MWLNLKPKKRCNINYLPLLFIPGLALKKFTQHAFKIFGGVSYVLLRVLPILDHRPVIQTHLHKKNREEEKKESLVKTGCKKYEETCPKRLRKDLKAGKTTSATASLRDSRNSLSGTVHWDCLWWSSSNWLLKVLNLSFTEALETPLPLPSPPTGPPPPDGLEPWTVRHWRIWEIKKKIKK